MSYKRRPRHHNRYKRAHYQRKQSYKEALDRAMQYGTIWQPDNLTLIIEHPLPPDTLDALMKYKPATQQIIIIKK